MALHRIDRANLQSLAVEKVVIVSVETNAATGSRVNGPSVLEIPTSGLNDQQSSRCLAAYRIVLPERSSHLEHRSNDHIRLEVAKLVQRKRRTPVEQHGKTEPRIAESGDFRLRGCPASLVLPDAQA